MKQTKIFGLLLLSCLINARAQTKSEKLNLYTFYSKSHAILKDDWFAPSIQRINDDLNVTIRFIDQLGTGNYGTKEFNQTMLDKIDLIDDAIKENWGGIFVYADIDIQFFRPFSNIIREMLKKYDMVIAKDSPQGTCCAGFFAARANKRVKRLWQDVRKLTPTTRGDDQGALNKFLRRTHPCPVKWAYLPKEFFGGGTLTGKNWEPGKSLPVPQNIIMHHANWTVGLPNKIAQLQLVAAKTARNRAD